MAYTYADAGHTVIATPDGRFVPASAENRDYLLIVASGEPILDYTPPVPTAADLKARAAERRWAAETGGIDAAVAPGTTIRVPTDDRAKLLLLGASTAMADGDTAPFVVGAVAVTLSGVQFRAIYGAIVAHVQACFATQTAVLAAIDAGTVTSLAEVDAWPWPE